VFAFLTGWPSIIAVILNYVKRGEAHGTWLESRCLFETLLDTIEAIRPLYDELLETLKRPQLRQFVKLLRT